MHDLGILSKLKIYWHFDFQFLQVGLKLIKYMLALVAKLKLVAFPSFKSCPAIPTKENFISSIDSNPTISPSATNARFNLYTPFTTSTGVTKLRHPNLAACCNIISARLFKSDMSTSESIGAICFIRSIASGDSFISSSIFSPSCNNVANPGQFSRIDWKLVLIKVAFACFFINCPFVNCIRTRMINNFTKKKSNI
ncbi:hypothetical protein AGLY_014125 [Aphis glycines]|uniref:Uncharacterized protein n=1 Tax=Aphis glycines TaxID=307491 RepID=A0A6G0T6C0_APHGL|nr:hypothetical protein AGLY_014125 [Aphis glycines]